MLGRPGAMPDNSEMLSPNDMMVDMEDVTGDLEARDTVIVNGDNVDDQLRQAPKADDFEAMKSLVLIPLQEEPRILDDVIHTWSVEAWRSMSKKEHGPVFQAGGYPWRILLFPHGNNVDQASIYLEHGFEPNGIPDNWSCCVQFALVLWNPHDPTLFCHHTAHHRFTRDESDWGFTRFLELRKMFNVPWEGGSASRPICEHEEARITAYVRVVEDETGVLWHNLTNYDSKKETGYVGLKNQGATCYLNSLLQSLYFTNAFRKAIYEIPTEQDQNMANSAYTLQRLFYQLQTCDSAVSTSELTKSFGWETRHIFEQQDVQELSRKLMERMEEKMKGTMTEPLLPEMFSGKIKTYISCINVDYESSRIEDFWDIQLNVSGNSNLLESLQDYIQVEKMDGENQYFAGEEFRLQDANKGVIFLGFPEVLHLQLKRFEYDVQRDTMTKINARYEFPDVFDAAPYLAAEADRSESWEYQLHGVLVHSGDLNAGHYYAFLKPEKDGWFYKYDDDKVTKATMREVLEENFGGEYRTPASIARGPLLKKTPIMRQNSAYMLVYIRKTRLDKILCPVTKEDIPEHLQQQIEVENAQREARKKEREEAHLYIQVKVITEETFRNYGGTDLTSFDAHPPDPAAPLLYRVLRASPLQEFLPQLAEDLGQDPRRIRLWLMVNRQNRTVRPDTPVTDLAPTVEETFSRTASHRDGSLRLWAEVAEEVNAEGEAIWPAHQGQLNGIVVKNDLVLLFLKHFDIDAQELRGVGHLYVSSQKKIEDLAPIILNKMGWPEKMLNDERILLWEEIKPNMIEPLKGKTTLKAAELQDGDIVCFQRSRERKGSGEKRLGSTESREEVMRSVDYIDDAKEYYDFISNRKLVRFLAHPAKCNPAKYPEFELMMNAKIVYDVLAERVGQALGGVPATHIRFWTVNSTTGNPKSPVKRLAANPPTLSAILHPTNYQPAGSLQRNDALFFEVLEMSLAELDSNKNIKLTWLSEGITKETPLEVFVSKVGTVEELVQALIRKADIPSEAEGGRIRVYEASNSKIYRELGRDFAVSNLNEYSNLYAERIPQEELAAMENRLIQAFHFHGEPSRVHGVPFKFLIIEDEEFSETRKRLEKRTGFKGKILEKIRFAVVTRVHFSKPQYLEDGDILFEMVKSDDDYLGLDHPDRSRLTRNGAGDLFLR